jgi:hypothetical protein
MSTAPEPITKIRRFENLHVVLWLIKDISWLLTWKLLGVIMIIPTLTVAIYLTWKSKGDVNNFWHNLAITCWISANATWMTGEFYVQDSLRPYALVFFILGFMSVGYYYLRPKL